MMTDALDMELVREFARDHSEAAFTELVQRHLNLVYSIARRCTGSDSDAQDVAQAVFVILARKAAGLRAGTVLTGWLYETTRHTAACLYRTNARRHAREQEAYMQSTLTDTDRADDWSRLAPHLEAGMSQLSVADRTLLALRFFENKSGPEAAALLGLREAATHKRTARALEKLRKFFIRRGVTLSTTAIAGAISAHSMQAAPAGLAAVISAAGISGAALSSAALIAVTQTIVMTTLQKTVITATLAVVAGAGIYEARQVAQLRDQVHTLQQQQAPLTEQIRQLQAERNRATNLLAATTEELDRVKKNPAEVLKLRGEVGRLHQENAQVTEKSALNKITANPETRKMLRAQQKLGMTAIYDRLAKQLNLNTNQVAQFNDLLADNVMDNIDLITQMLHDGKSREQINQAFSVADSTLLEKIQTMVGTDGLAAFQTYNQNLVSALTAQQFSGQLTGDEASRKEKQQQLEQILQTEAQAALASAGLPADFQAVPILNFRNIASEEEAEQNLKLLDTIYERTADRASAFLSADELAKFKEFRTAAITNSRLMLTMNRKLMAPLAK